jgi:hypothetical protein
MFEQTPEQFSPESAEEQMPEHENSDELLSADALEDDLELHEDLENLPI